MHSSYEIKNHKRRKKNWHEKYSIMNPNCKPLFISFKDAFLEKGVLEAPNFYCYPPKSVGEKHVVSFGILLKKRKRVHSKLTLSMFSIIIIHCNLFSKTLDDICSNSK